MADLKIACREQMEEAAMKKLGCHERALNNNMFIQKTDDLV
ncbi:hypothetical protein [Mucilaginibacter sp. SP1R1]|nr:hypothetical protein [Mucilaginibacter sp. SP1R1]MBB6148306.1 hypothetical protein [Mucilaginibacter sp. SP1R1]